MSTFRSGKVPYRVMVNLPAEIHAELDMTAVLTNRPLAAVAREVLRAWAQRQRQHATRPLGNRRP